MSMFWGKVGNADTWYLFIENDFIVARVTNTDWTIYHAGQNGFIRESHSWGSNAKQMFSEAFGMKE